MSLKMPKRSSDDLIKEPKEGHTVKQLGSI